MDIIKINRILYKHNLNFMYRSFDHPCSMRFLRSTHDTAENEINKRVSPNERKIKEDKENLKWRTPISDRKDEWYSKFKLFTSEKDTNSAVVIALQQPFDITPSSIKKWFKNKNIKNERFMQQYIPKRHVILGNDLAAAHFIVHRGGKVKFRNIDKWIENCDGNYKLPDKYDPNFSIEAIKCDNMELYYEGLENIRRLNHLKFLSFHNVKQFDDWCLDRVSGSEFPILEVLDLSGTMITENGLRALYRIPTLKLLVIDDITKNKSIEIVCMQLEHLYPQLKIIAASTIH